LHARANRDLGYFQGDQYSTVHLGQKVKPDDATIYELGSISKVFTSLLLADAVVKGEIELDGEADAPNGANIKFPSHNYRRVKWIDLSTHRSGLPRLPVNMDATTLIDPYKLYDSKKAAAALNELELPRSPGQSQEYSNFAVSVLGYMIGENTGKSYQQLLQERVSKPLGMADCSVSLSEDQKKRLATPHSSFGQDTPAWSFADLPGAGGIRATMSDMMLFAKAQLNPPEGKLGEAIELAWQQHTEASDSGSAMGLGWMIQGDGTHWHNGGTGGSRSMLLLNRTENLAIIVLCNTAEREVDQLAKRLMLQATGEEPLETSSPQVENGKQAPKVSPFNSVGFFKEKVFVGYGKETYLWLEIDGVPVKEIVAAAKKHYGDRWEKRIREDLVEVLWKMDHKPGDTVTLRLQNFKTKKETVIDSAPMTKANRKLLWREQQLVEEMGEKGKGGSAFGVKIDADHRARLVGRYKLAANFIFDVKDRDGHLMVGITNQPTQEVFPDSKTHWSYRGVKATLEFKLPNKGSAKSLILHQNGIKQTAKRIGR